MAKTTTTTLHNLVGKRFVGITADGQRVMIDGEKVAQTGMRPMQLLLNAVGACAAYDIVEMLAKRRLEVRGYRIELVGERAEARPSPYERITATHYLDVPGLDERTARRFVGLATTKYCSVAASLKAEVAYEVVLEREGAEVEGAGVEGAGVEGAGTAAG